MVKIIINDIVRMKIDKLLLLLNAENGIIEADDVKSFKVEKETIEEKLIEFRRLL